MPSLVEPMVTWSPRIRNMGSGGSTLTNDVSLSQKGFVLFYGTTKSKVINIG